MCQGMVDLPGLPPDDVGLLCSDLAAVAQPKAKRPRLVVRRGPLPSRTSAQEGVSGPGPSGPQGRAQDLEEWPELPADVGDLPEDLFGELALEGPLEGPGWAASPYAPSKEAGAFPGPVDETDHGDLGDGPEALHARVVCGGATKQIGEHAAG